MPPAPHTAVPLDHWTTASYTGLWNYLDFPAVVIPVDDAAASDVLDETTTAKYGPDDAKSASCCSDLLASELSGNLFQTAVTRQLAASGLDAALIRGAEGYVLIVQAIA
ncbi:amidase [Alternaria alternata]|nr:amidase [Alternaria alternata]